MRIPSLPPLDVNTLLKTVGAVALLVLGRFLDRWFTKKPKVISYVGHASVFTLRTEEPKIIHTHAIVIANMGRLQATNVRIGHAELPAHYQVSPAAVAYKVERREGKSRRNHFRKARAWGAGDY